MSAELKAGPMRVITEYVKSRTLSVTRQEIIKGTGLAQDQVRKATNQLVAKGRLTTETDDLGVTRYLMVNENAESKKKAWPSVTLISDNTELYDKLQDSTIKVKDRPNTPWREVTTHPTAWNSLVAEAEQRGFAKGYTKGLQEAQREAYEDGKRAVITKLEALLA